MQDAMTKRWLSSDSLFNSATVQKHNETINGQFKIEPFKDFNIDLSFKRSESWQQSSYYKYNTETMRMEGPLSPYRTGNFSISTVALKTLFKGSDKQNISSVFETFLQNRQTIARRLSEINRNTHSDYDATEVWDTVSNQFWPDGYGASSQQVLIPSFLAAYLGKSVTDQSLNPFINIPMPNWRITWTGLGKTELLKKWVNSVTVSSNYSCTYNISSFYTNSAVPDEPDYT